MNNLSITTTRGSYNIQQPKGQQNIVQTKPKLRVDKKAPRVIIDSYQPRAEQGLKNNIDLLKQATQLGKQATLKAISRMVGDGNRMADIRNSMPPAMPELAKKNSRPKVRDFNLALTPKSRPKIDIEGYINIDWQMGQTDINYTPQKPKIHYNQGYVDIQVSKTKWG